MTDFHFIRPWWLLAFFALFLVIFLLKRMRVAHSGWQQFLPGHLAKVLIDGSSTSKPLSLTVPFVIGLLSIIALAGPTWEKLPQPVYQIQRGSVLIMDMSYSMYSTDITPNRLTRAKYKATDLLDNLNEGEIGLIAYAGDAFTISPLTDDINNIKVLLPAISPEIMPVLGSNPLAALTLANEMLKNAGHLEGDIYWFTDGIDNEDIQDINDWSRESPHRLNILGVGSASGAPITLPSGELMKDNSGAIVVPKTNEKRLYGLASRGRGSYRTITNDNSDINTLIEQAKKASGENKNAEEDESRNKLGDQWQEMGPYLLVLLLPFLLGYFRRGTVLLLLPFCFLLSPQQSAYALEWQDLWQTKDQQAQQKYNQQNYSEAAAKFKDPLWQASAQYKAGDYQKAVESFSKFDSADALYNKGNALAKLQQLDEAIAAYEQALEKAPNHLDAQKNKSVVEQLKQQQEQQEQQEQQNKENQEQKDQDKQEQKDQQQDQQNQQESEQESDQQENSENQQGQQSEQEKKDQQSDAEQQSEQEKQEEQQKAEQESAEQQKAEQQAKQETGESKDEPQDAQSQQARLAQEKLKQETEQKHQQLLNMVTDDPYLLLRNKMQIEYQKRRQDGSQSGVQKKW